MRILTHEGALIIFTVQLTVHTSASSGCMNLLKALATSQASFIRNIFMKSETGEELGVCHDASFLTLTLSLPWDVKKDLCMHIHVLILQ